MRAVNYRFLVIAVLSVLSLTGCRRHFSLISPATPGALSATEYTPGEYKMDVESYKSAAAGMPRAEIRDRILFGLMRDIDLVYGEYTTRLYSGKGTEAVTADSALLGLTAASTIATHVATKTILSALGTAVGGLNLSLDKNFFAQQTFQAIAIAMQTRRDKIRKVIDDKRTDSTKEYSLAQAQRDLIPYFYAGTLAGGLQEIQEEAGKESSAQTLSTTTH